MVFVYVLMALVRQRELFLVVAALAGAGWTLSASELWVAAQRAMPSWARGRMNATVIMVSQGAIALGGIVWGFSSQVAGVNVTLVVAAVAMALSLLLAIPLSINFTTSLSFDPPPINCVMMPLVNNPQPRDGPVAITFEIEVDRMRGREFLRLMREVRLIHRRNGAFGWRLDEDLTRSNIYRIEMMVPSWTGYLLQRERLTKAEQETINKVWHLHVGEDVPEERYYLSVNRELNARGTMVTHPLSLSKAPLDLPKRSSKRRDRALRRSPFTVHRSPFTVHRSAFGVRCSPFGVHGIQVLRHEVMLVSGRMILQRPKYTVPQFFVEGSRLKTEGVEECIGTAALDRIVLGTLHQFLAKAAPSHWGGHRKRSHVQPSRPNISEQTAQYFALFVPEKESDRIPFALSGHRNIVIIKHGLHNIAQIGTRVRIEYYLSIAHNKR